MDGQKPILRQKITTGHMGMDVLNTTSGSRMISLSQNGGGIVKMNYRVQEELRND
jgi:hypothetical protein